MKKIKKRKLGIIAITSALTVTFFVPILFAAIFMASGDQTGPIIQMTATDGFRVVWWDPQADEGMICVTGPDQEERLFKAGRDGYRFEAVALGLEPGINYNYEIFSINEQGSKSQWAEGQTKTAVLEGEPFSFTVFGDSGSGSREQYELA